LLAAPLLVLGIRPLLTIKHGGGFIGKGRSSSSASPERGSGGCATWPFLRAYVLFWAVGWYCAHLLPWMGGNGGSDTAGGGSPLSFLTGDTAGRPSPLASLIGFPLLHCRLPAHIRPRTTGAAATAGTGTLQTAAGSVAASAGAAWKYAAAAGAGEPGPPPALSEGWGAPGAGETTQLVIAAQAAALLLLGLWLAMPKDSPGTAVFEYSPSAPGSQYSHKSKHSPDSQNNGRPGGALLRLVNSLSGWPGAELCAAVGGCVHLLWVLAIPSAPSVVLLAVGLAAMLAAPAWPWRGYGTGQPAGAGEAGAADGEGRSLSAHGSGGKRGGGGRPPARTVGGRFAGLPPPGRRSLPPGHLPLSCGLRTGAPPGTSMAGAPPETIAAGVPPGAIPASRWLRGCLIFAAAWLIVAYTTIAAWRYLHAAAAEQGAAAGAGLEQQRLGEGAVSGPAAEEMARGPTTGGWAAVAAGWAAAAEGMAGSGGADRTTASRGGHGQLTASSDPPKPSHAHSTAPCI
jgi:hypothetical protein